MLVQGNRQSSFESRLVGPVPGNSPLWLLPQAVVREGEKTYARNTEDVGWMRILVDLDNVLADFILHVHEHFGAHPDDISSDDLWSMVESVPDFWLTIPLKNHAHDLWEFVQPYSPVILTGCPKHHYEVAAAHKVTWVHQNFGVDTTVITCLSKDKQKHLISPADILIDDFSSNVKRWRKAGGRAVRYKDYEQTIAELRILLNEERAD